jgi:benzodiazapine receptor
VKELNSEIESSFADATEIFLMPILTTSLPRAKLVLFALAALIPVAAAFTISNLTALPNLGWYETLTKPSFNPPNWLFGAMWTLLYLLMAWAFFRVLCRPDWVPDRPAAIRAFLAQIILNAFWSIAFFAAHSPAAGLAAIVALLIAVAITGRLFSLVDRWAGWCFVPYGLWVAFVAAINLSITIKN